jgi:hypothetical protein
LHRDPSQYSRHLSSADPLVDEGVRITVEG